MDRQEQKPRPSISGTSRARYVPNSEGGFDAFIIIHGEEYSLGSYGAEDEDGAQKACKWANLKVLGDASSSSANEIIFQEFYSRDEVLEMIKDGSYYHELWIFVNRHPEEQFRKELSATDVRSSNGLVISSNKKKHFVGIKSRDKVDFFDWDDNKWTFEYRDFLQCYLSPAARWKEFVRAKNLHVRDVLVFFHCRGKDRKGERPPYRMIAIIRNRRGPKKTSNKPHVHEDTRKQEDEKIDVRSRLRPRTQRKNYASRS